MVNMKTAAPVSSLEKIIQCLKVVSLSQTDGLTATQISGEAGMPKATTHRLLKSLVDQRMLAYDPATKHYRLGSTVLNLGLSALRQLNVPRVARPYLEKLSRQTLETATLSMVQGDLRVYLEQVPSTQEIKMTVPLGMTFPLYAGASSKAILSTFSDEGLRAYLERSELTPLTDYTIPDRESLFHEIEEIRVLGYSVSRGERQADAASIAAPVMGSGGSVFGAISVSGPVQRFDRYGHRSIGRMVKESAEELSAELGYHEAV